MTLLLENIHYHTMTVELMARLLSYRTITAQTLLSKLKENVLFKEDISNITLNKDNINHKLAYYKHIESLLDLQQLESDTLTVLSVIALAPDSGFPVKLFYDWHGAYINELQILEECGLLVKDHQRLLLNPYLRKIINARKILSLSQAPAFFATLLQTVSDSNHEHIRFALDILNTTLLFVDKDERTTWKKLVAHGLESSSRLHHYRLFQKLLGEYEGICYLYQNITNEDNATLLHYKATEASMIHQNLAAVHASMRNVKAALMYYAQAENIFQKFLDEEHPDLLICKEQQENVIGMDGQKVDLLEEKKV